MLRVCLNNRAQLEELEYKAIVEGPGQVPLQDVTSFKPLIEKHNCEEFADDPSPPAATFYVL